jgi:mono/diheme cytochrome c family protein
MRLFLRTLAAVALLAIVLAVLGLWWVSRHQFSARATPSWLEEMAAQRLRRLAMGPGAGDRKNPVPASAEAVRDGLEHFADHCAVCHANDGSGDTETGRGLYPKTPDMRLDRTQRLTDGELFFIIQNGVRFTGMPAWGTGTPENEEANWRLVHFIRHLPKISANELTEMERLNPKSLAELDAEREAQEFLQGGSQPDQPSTPTHTHK